MLGKVSYPGLFFQLDAQSGNYEELAKGKGFQGPSLRYRKIEKLEHDPLFRALIDKGDAPGLERLMTEARTSRESWKARRGSPLE